VVKSGAKWVPVVGYGGIVLARDVARFTGRAEGALDDKGRFVVPARFRERLGATFVVTIARPDPCLVLYPLATWDAFCERLEAAPVKDERYRRFVRHLFAHTDEAACDGQGRLLIPAALRAYAGMERDVVSIGSLTRVELWSKGRLDEVTPSEGEAAAFMTELGLY
jgi:MraZ protein